MAGGSLVDFLDDADVVEKICRQLCTYTDEDPDGAWFSAYGAKFKNHQKHGAKVRALLMAIRDLPQ